MATPMPTIRAPRYYDQPRYERRYVVEPDAYSANASAYVVGGRVPVGDAGSRHCRPR